GVARAHVALRPLQRRPAGLLRVLGACGRAPAPPGPRTHRLHAPARSAAPGAGQGTGPSPPPPPRPGSHTSRRLELRVRLGTPARPPYRYSIHRSRSWGYSAGGPDHVAALSSLLADATSSPRSSRVLVSRR